jgi:hypothetical protein
MEFPRARSASLHSPGSDGDRLRGGWHLEDDRSGWLLGKGLKLVIRS